MNDILNVFLVIIVVGVVMWLINAFLPMAGPFKTLLNLLALILVVIYIMQTFGFIAPILPEIRLIR